MIVRVQFVVKEDGSIIFPWALFKIAGDNVGSKSLLEVFNGIVSGVFSCGKTLNFHEYDTKNVHCMVATVSKLPSKCDLMSAMLEISLNDVKENNVPLYIQFELSKTKSDSEEQSTTSSTSPDKTSSKSTKALAENEKIDTVTNFLMNRQNCFVMPKTNTKHRDVQQYNAIVDFIKESECGVRSTSLADFEKFVQTYSSLLWELDPHYYKIKQYAGRFPDVVESHLLGFNDPKSHGHSVKHIDMNSLLSKVTMLTLYLERKFMQSSHMKPMEHIVSVVCKGVCKYNEYLEAKRINSTKQHEKVDDADDDSSVENFTVRKVKRCDFDKPHVKHLRTVKSLFDTADKYVPINISDNIGPLSRIETFRLFKSVREIGIPFLPENCAVFYFRLPSKGSHPAIHFLWKGDMDSNVSDGENTKVLLSIRATQKMYYSRASRKLVKQTLHRIGVTKSFKAEYLIRSLLGDASAPHSEQQRQTLQRFDDYVSLGEDIICDLRENNGAVPKYDKFWDIVSEYVESKTAIDDRRHTMEEDGDLVVSMALATCYSDLYRQCVKIAMANDPPVDVPSKAWFLLQFWPTSKSLSALTNYTGRFKVKRMVQARLLRKNNPDSHYCNAIYSFLKERAVQHSESTAMISADAKCKISVGEPDFPLASVSRGKGVIVGKNQTFKVGDHDFSKSSLIPDAILVHTIPDAAEVKEEEFERNKQSVGNWYRGKVFYSVKNMATEGSTANRGAAEISSALHLRYANDVPPRLYLYTDGGGDRKNNNFKVQKSLISLFLRHDLDEVVSARPCAGHSYRNPVERCHCIANLGLQSVGVMRTKMDNNFEHEMKKCDGNHDIRKQCERDEKFKEEFLQSMKAPTELIEYVLKNLSLKDEPFEILQPADVDDIDALEKELGKIDKHFTAMNSMKDAKNSNVIEFYNKHCTSRTYFFQVRKCDDISCSFHQPMRGDIATIDVFPDPVPTEVDGSLHYQPGSDPTEKFLPSKLEDVEKSPHNVPFPPTAQTAKNVGFTVSCMACKKPRLLHSKTVVKVVYQKPTKRMIEKLDYVCGSVLSEYEGTGNEKDRKLLNNIHVRENISCSSKIELPYYSVDHFPKICIYCGVRGTSRSLGSSPETYPKCESCKEKPEVQRRKRKAVLNSDLLKKKKK